MDGICDICGVRPATVRAQVVSGGERQTMELCDTDYRRLARQQGRTSSPLESLFGRGGGGLFDEFFGDSLFSDRPVGFRSGGDDDADVGGARRIPIGRGGRRGPPGLAERLSQHAEELLQVAARKAADLGRREVDTEHLLLALTESDVVRTILDQFKVSVDDLRRQVEKEARREEPAKGKERESAEIGVSPRIKDALARAFAASQDLGHSYVGPEHLLIGLAEEGEGIAADILKRYGLTPQAIRQQVTKVVGHGAEEGRVEPPSGRSREIETTIEVLARRKKNNPVLIGEPGVGKTAIVEGLAQRIVAG
jgi:ATP-dependent Clp protease ATP-binding subunit ClpC